MPHSPKPFYQANRSTWYVEINRKQYRLLVIVLVLRWDILNEVRARLPPELRPIILRPRPSICFFRLTRFVRE
jgi:hypothetical protein